MISLVLWPKYGIFSGRDLPRSYERQPRTMAIVWHLGDLWDFPEPWLEGRDFYALCYGLHSKPLSSKSNTVHQCRAIPWIPLKVNILKWSYKPMGFQKAFHTSLVWFNTLYLSLFCCYDEMPWLKPAYGESLSRLTFPEGQSVHTGKEGTESHLSSTHGKQREGEQRMRQGC